MNIFNFQQPTLFQMSSLFKSVLRSQNHPQSLKLKLKAQSSIQCEHTEVFSLSLFLSISCGVSLVSVGLSVNLVSRWRRRETSDCRPQRNRSTEPRSRHESLIRRRPCGPAEVSTGPRLPASPSGHWGGPISSSHGEALWP